MDMVVNNSEADAVPRIYIALVHYPVLNKRGDIIASAVTNLDLHDIARAAKTYGVAEFFVVTPLADQKRLAERIVAHWTTGGGPGYNEKRAEAFALITVSETLAEAVARIETQRGRPPALVVTTARQHEGAVGCDELLRLDRDVLLVFGTGWGIAPSLTETADYILKPIAGVTGYNHLSVRSAVSILLDRMIWNDI
ncbi:MAG: RNA methyltransferase [Thermodesulfobacteriota bacterium]|nr:RNA methyltransferase [Thermodesulfobacteriota bacterium]